MTDDRNKRQVPAPPETEIVIRNPRYEGATPEQVARALARHEPKDDKKEER